MHLVAVSSRASSIIEPRQSGVSSAMLPRRSFPVTNANVRGRSSAAGSVTLSIAPSVRDKRTLTLAPPTSEMPSGVCIGTFLGYLAFVVCSTFSYSFQESLSHAIGCCAISTRLCLDRDHHELFSSTVHMAQVCVELMKSRHYDSLLQVKPL